MKISKHTQQIVDAMVDELSHHGISVYSLGRKSKHGVLKFNVNGAEKMIIFSTTHGDWRAVMNQRKLVRHACR